MCGVSGKKHAFAHQDFPTTKFIYFAAIPCVTAREYSTLKAHELSAKEQIVANSYRIVRQNHYAISGITFLKVPMTGDLSSPLSNEV